MCLKQPICLTVIQLVIWLSSRHCLIGHYTVVDSRVVASVEVSLAVVGDVQPAYQTSTLLELLVITQLHNYIYI